jgi:poly(3-hydroxybutyrate) depolymerase
VKSIECIKGKSTVRKLAFCSAVIVLLLIAGCVRTELVRTGRLQLGKNPYPLRALLNRETTVGPDDSFGLGTSDGSIVHDHLTRTFVIHVPPSYKASVATPVVLMFHGGFGNGAQFEKNSGMDKLADQEGFITVYPDGLGPVPTWNGGDCCGYARKNNIDDVGFVSDLIDYLETKLNVDPDRIYASGMSNGGILCYRLACELSDKIAAIGPVEGGMLVDS